MLDDLDLPVMGDLRSAFGEVAEAKALHAKADALVTDALQRIRDTLVTLALQIGDDADLTGRVLQYLYWMEPDIKVSWLAEAFNLKTPQVFQYAGKASLPLTCSRCGVEYRVVVNSRQAMRDSQRPAWGGGNISTMCPDCREAVTNDLRVRAEAARVAWETRLRQLRTMPYREYLKTPEWQERRAKHLRRASYRCQVCNASRTQLNVHHRTYQQRGNEDFKDLIVLCADCHTLFHTQGKLAWDE